MLIESWESFFKSEVRTSGQKLYAQEKISLSTGSDTSIQAYVRGAPPFKIHLSSEDISSESFTAECSCPAAKKGQFCKHIWAALLCVEQKYPDFLSAKKNIEVSSVSSDDPKTSFQEAAKLRASLYRKVQYQKQKLRAQEQKAQKRERLGGKTSLEQRVFPPEIEVALAYLSENGFPMPTGPAEDVISEAKRKLSRVFHPDRGGSHTEIVELNRHCEVLMRFLRV